MLDYNTKQAKSQEIPLGYVFFYSSKSKLNA